MEFSVYLGASLWFSTLLGLDAANLKLNFTTNRSFPFGILKVSRNGLWGTVCNDGWDMNATNVACRQLGYTKGLAFLAMGNGTGQIWLDNVTCTGSESSLDNCVHQGWGVHDCDHTKDVGIVCQSVFFPIAVRLTGGSNSKEGRVEVRYNNVWGTICDDGWTLNNANVICKMMGFQKALKNKKFGSGSGQIWLDDVSCTGSETSIDKCHHRRWGIHNCHHSKDTGVICLQGSPNVKVRLKDGIVSNAGRVEVRYYGVWKSICDTKWDLRDAHVICRMLGYSQGAAAIIRGYQSSGDVWLSDVWCNGHELSIERCRNAKWGQTACGNNKRAGVLCKSGSSIIQFSVTAGAGSQSGRLKMRYYGTLGAVCADYFDLQDANVVCRMMGYSRAATIYKQVHSDSMFSFSLVVYCNGHERSIMQCRYHLYRINACGSNNDVWIVCKPAATWTTRIRLQAGSSNMKAGRVEIQQYGVWGTVCNSGWNILDANVVCRMLNYKGAIRVYKAGGGSGPIWLTGLGCKGDEKDILNCTHNGLGKTSSCSHFNDAGVVCHSYSDIQVRLAGGVSPYSGRVEVKFNNIWKTICGGWNWDINDAHVVCRMLSFKRAKAAIRWFGGGSRNIWLLNVHCTGEEKSLDMCLHDGWVTKPRSVCNYGYSAGVICDEYTARDPNIAVRLVGGSTSNQGRAEVRYYGVWGRVCTNNWQLIDAHVVCRMLNYSKASWAGRSSINGKGSVLLSNLGCFGKETSVVQCRDSEWGLAYCNSQQNAGVVCGNLSTEESLVTVRVVEEQHNYGRVEVNYKGIWRPVCDDTWDILDAHVICRMLGYNAALAGIKRFSAGKVGLWMGGVECSGKEKSISECYHRGWSNRWCNGRFNAAVLCQESKSPPTVEISLEEGGLPNSGRVAVRYGNVWGTICNRGLDINDAKVICGMLGYVGASKVYPKPTYRPGNSTIWLSNLGCNGTEKSINNCPHSGWGQTATCNHYNDAGVMCKKVDIPRFLINGSSAVTESTAFLLVEASNPIEKRWRSVHQIVVQKIINEIISSSLDQTQEHLPANLENITMATKNGSLFYITAEVLYSTSPSNFTIGDGLYYKGYYNAPLDPGCIYKVYVRIVTKASTGRKVYGDSSFVAFTTKPVITKASATKSFQVHGSAVIVLSIALMVLIGLIVGYSVRLNLRNKKADKKPKSQDAQGLEMTSANIRAAIYDNTEEQYQSLIRLSTPQQEDSYYVNVSDGDRKRYQASAATSSVNTNVYERDEVLYENVTDAKHDVRTTGRFK